MASYVSNPLSRQDIRNYAMKIRRLLKVENNLYFPVIKFFEIMPLLFEENGLYTEIVEDDELPPSVHAEYSYDKNCIQVKRFVYDGACDNSGRDRMTIAHEIGHYLLIRESGVGLFRSFSDNVPTYQDPEWQAKCFAGELLIPAGLVKGMSVGDIAKKCCVSWDAANFQLSKIK